MTRAGIAIDSWKLPIFKQHLNEARFAFEQGQGVTDDTLMLYVETDDVQRLAVVIEEANAAAARRKLN